MPELRDTPQLPPDVGSSAPAGTPASDGVSAQASPPASNRASTGTRGRGRASLIWLMGPLLLVVGIVAVILVTQGEAALFGWTIGVFFSVGLGWVLVSSLFPAEPDRTCPECSGETLVRIDPLSTRGIRCVSCGFRDEDASSFLMAEQEGSLEPAILMERGRGPARGRLRRSIPRRPPRIAEDRPPTP